MASPRGVFGRCCAPLVVLLLALVLAPARARAQGCAECPANQKPLVTISPRSNPSNAASIEVTVTVWDDNALPNDPESLGITWTTSYWNTPRTQGVFTYTLALTSGVTLFKVEIEDADGAIGKDSVFLTYEAPPPTPPSQGKPAIDPSPYSSSVRSIACTGCLHGTASYSTPAYISRDLPRSVTLFYSNAAAEGRALVRLNAAIHTSTTPSTVSLRLVDSTAAAVSLTNGGTASYYTGTAGPMQLGAQLASGLATGVYPFTAVVTADWSGTPYDTTAVIRVFVANEAASPLGAGWSIAGLERLLFRGDSVAIYDPSAGFTFYRRTGASTFANEPGAFGTMTVSGGVYTLTRMDGSWTRYSSVGQMTATGNRFGDSTSYTYNGTKLTSIVDEVGKTTTLTYAPDALCPGGSTSGTLCAVTDPGGRVSKVVVNGSNDLVTIYDPAGKTVFSGTYSGHRLTSSVDRLGSTTALYYNVFATLDSVVSQAVTTTTTGGSTATEAPKTTFRSIEAAVLGVSNTSSGSARASVLPDSALARVTTLNGTTTAMQLSGVGEPTSLRVTPVAGPAHSVDTYYNADYLPIAVARSPTGGITEYGWAADTLQWVKDPSGTRTEYVRWANYGLITDVTVNGTVVESNSYSGSGDSYNLVASLRGGVHSQFKWDTLGRLTQDSTRGQKTTYSYAGSGYDNLHQVVSLSKGTLVTTTHDALGRDSIVATTNGQANTITYDLLNRVTGVTQVGPAVTATTVSENTGSHTSTVSVTDPRSLVFASQSNALGWTTTVTDPHANATTLGYDRNGLLRRVVNRASGVITMSYDSLARPVTIVANGDTTAFTYDNTAAGPFWTVARTLAVKDSVNLDAMGRPTTVVTTLGGLTWTQTSTYNVQGRNKLKISDGLNAPDSLQFSINNYHFPEYVPDFAGRMTRTYHNPATGLLDTLRFPTTGSGSPSTHLRQLPSGYNAYGQPTSVVIKAGSTTVQHWRYEYDASGRITRMDSTLVTDFGYFSRHYTYDAPGRLYSYRDVNYFPGDSMPIYDPMDEETIVGWDYVWGEYEIRAVTFAPDYSGNRTDGSATYSNDRLTSMTGADGVAYSFTYDAEGRRLSKTAPGYSQTYGWNDRGQLIWVKTNGDSVAYKYDAAGRRIEKKGAATTYYLWDGDHLAVEWNTSVGKWKYAYLPGIDRPVAVTTGGSTYYYTLDEEGNVRTVWNSSNGESEVYTYDPYGYLLGGGGSLNHLRWKGREFDSDVGLYYMRARWYDPVVGRFISEDPIGLAGGINPYVFADGEPANRADPSGLEYICTSGPQTFKNPRCIWQLDPIVSTATPIDWDAWWDDVYASFGTPVRYGGTRQSPGHVDPAFQVREATQPGLSTQSAVKPTMAQCRSAGFAPLRSLSAELTGSLAAITLGGAARQGGLFMAAKYFQGAEALRNIGRLGGYVTPGAVAAAAGSAAQWATLARLGTVSLYGGVAVGGFLVGYLFGVETACMLDTGWYSK